VRISSSSFGRLSRKYRILDGSHPCEPPRPATVIAFCTFYFCSCSGHPCIISSVISGRGWVGTNDDEEKNVSYSNAERPKVTIPITELDLHTSDTPVALHGGHPRVPPPDAHPWRRGRCILAVRAVWRTAGRWWFSCPLSTLTNVTPSGKPMSVWVSCPSSCPLSPLCAPRYPLCGGRLHSGSHTDPPYFTLQFNQPIISGYCCFSGVHSLQSYFLSEQLLRYSQCLTPYDSEW
jgi:hypothetical protein